MNTLSRMLPVTAILFCLVSMVPQESAAQLIDLSKTQHVDLGDIGSNGESGRQLHVRELLDDEVGRRWAYFPPHTYFPDRYPATPPSPSQDSLDLTEDMPLVAVIPQLQHKPVVGTVDIDYRLIGNILTIDAALHTTSARTATIYGPHEFLLPIGDLDAGQYHLDFNLTRTNDFSDAVVTMSGYMDFRVNAVPEPSTIGCLFVGLLLIGSYCHRNHRRRAI